MSAVIYAAIVVMWAVVLVPMWLKRHDAQTESRSVDRFSTAMRTLSRRTSAAPGRRYVVMPQRSHSAPTVHVSGPAAPRPSAPRPVARPGGPARPRTSLVARRRRMLLGMSAALGLGLLLTVAGILPLLVPVVVLVVLAAYCAHLRAEARRAAAVSRQRRRATVATQPGVSWNAAVPAPRPVDERPVAAPVVAAEQVAPQVVAEPAVVEEPAVAAEPVDDPLEETAPAATWEPVPVPRPTYTMKPPAPAYEADPTYSPPVYAPAARSITGIDDEAESDLDEILARRWAVND